MGSRLERRKNRVKEEISIFKVLAGYGYQVQENDYEQQFCCDLHGDGQDVKPSARVYTDNSWYCFACNEQRDTISTIQAKEDLGFVDAIAHLEQQYQLPRLPWEDSDEVYVRPKSATEELDSVYQAQKVDYPQMAKRVFTLLDGITKDKSLELPVLLTLWEVYDMISWKIEKKKLSEGKGVKLLEKLREKMIEKLKEAV